ncbi:MAG: hypothetical protein ACU84H_09770 [Gammaproteobacteria bacterium]
MSDRAILFQAKASERPAGRLQAIKRSMKALSNKSVFTPVAVLFVMAMGYVAPLHQELIKSIGFFALSGALTHWLAIWGGVFGGLMGALFFIA